MDKYKIDAVSKIITADAGNGEKSFCFDEVLSLESNQVDAFAAIAKPPVLQRACADVSFDSTCVKVDAIFDGYNGTIFAYGQTGSGKSYTMFGKENSTDPLLQVGASVDLGPACRVTTITLCVLYIANCVPYTTPLIGVVLPHRPLSLCLS